MKKPKIGLVLSGGAALGYAHIGVIKRLLEDGIEPRIVVGTSMGAVVGGGYAMGVSVDDMIAKSEKMGMTKFFDFNFPTTGLFTGKRMTKFLKTIYKETTDKDLKCKFATVACDLVTGKQVVLRKGSLVDMIRPSMNIPGIFVPVRLGDMKLVDGGIINNYPDDVANKMGADIIIGVDVLKNSYSDSHLTNPLMVLFNSLQLLQNELYRHKNLVTDVLIAPNLKMFNQADFKKGFVKEFIEVGYRACDEQMGKIKKLITNWEKDE